MKIDIATFTKIICTDNCFINSYIVCDIGSNDPRSVVNKDLKLTLDIVLNT
jgi:hypothetical protein